MTSQTSRRRMTRAFWGLTVVVLAALAAFALRGLWV